MHFFVSSMNSIFKVHKFSTMVKSKKYILKLCNLFYSYGYISSYTEFNNYKKIQIFSSCDNSINYLKLFSRPSSQIYWSFSKLKYNCIVKGCRFVVSTDKGIFFSNEAINQTISGEICISLH